jgi:nicotinate-nucleotide pyrophosphorylase (carboxylating)
VIVREDAVLCGTAWFAEVFNQLDSGIQISWSASDGSELEAGDVVCEITGPARPVLTGERTALNFLQTLSGTATAAQRYSAAVSGTKTRILDTRKTLPGLRLAQKYAVRCGGAKNHRLGLYDAILIKENHIATAGGISAAIEAARQASPDVLIEIEVETEDQLKEALTTDTDRILLDNFSTTSLREAVALRDRKDGKRKELEASGGIDLGALREIAETGVDFISVGGLTKNLAATDFSMRFS